MAIAAVCTVPTDYTCEVDLFAELPRIGDKVAVTTPDDEDGTLYVTRVTHAQSGETPSIIVLLEELL